MDLTGLEAALCQLGLRSRGWVIPEIEDAPRLANSTAASAICLVGYAGGECWPIFENWHKANPAVLDPLDTWSKSVITPVARQVGGEVVFPSDKPWHPFQQWSMAAEGLKPSPLGMLIHPEFGLWHGYRGAIVFGDEALARLMPREDQIAGAGSTKADIHPCDNCLGKPCLTACPVEAFSRDGFAVSACRSYLKTSAGAQGCMISGCMARDACPVGRTYRYGSAQIQFHMAAYS